MSGNSDRRDDSAIQDVRDMCIAMRTDIKHILARQEEHAQIQKEWQKDHIDKDHAIINQRLSSHSTRMNGMVVAAGVAVIGTLLSFIGWVFR